MRISPWNGSSPAGSSAPSCSCAPPTSKAGRCASCSSWPTRTAGGAGTSCASATPNRPDDPALRAEIASLYERVSGRRRARLRRRRGGDLRPPQRPARARRPRRRRPAGVPVAGRGGPRRRRGRDAGRAARGERLAARRRGAPGRPSAEHAPDPGQRAAQPDRRVERPGDLRSAGRAGGRVGRAPDRGRGLPLPRIRSRQTVCRPAPDALRNRREHRRHVEVVRAGRDCASAGSRRGTASCWRGWPRSRTTPRSATRPRARCWP